MTAEQTVESVQEGCRWLHAPPTGGEFAEWFQGNVKLHDGLDHGDYVNGITLIPNKERLDVTRLDSQGNPQIVETQRLVFSPYPQAETRVRYFWDWCRENGYLGEIEILPATKQHPELPPGFNFTRVKKDQATTVEFISVKARVHVFERDVRTGDPGRVVMEPPPATKMVPLRGRYGPDENAPLKAETGAIGRALGFAGMLVIPGAGISTAEDMQEFAARGAAAAVPEATAELPPVETADPLEEASPQDAEQALRKMVDELAEQLAGFPTEWAQFEKWADERDLPLENIPPAALRPLEKQLRRKLDQAMRNAAS